MMINKKLDTTYLKPSDKNYEKVPNVLELRKRDYKTFASGLQSNVPSLPEDGIIWKLSSLIFVHQLF